MKKKINKQTNKENKNEAFKINFNFDHWTLLKIYIKKKNKLKQKRACAQVYNNKNKIKFENKLLK